MGLSVDKDQRKSKLEDMSIQTVQTEKQREKRKVKKGMNSQEL